MGKIIDFNSYKNKENKAEEDAIKAANIIVEELQGDVDTKEVHKLFNKIPSHYLSRLTFALDSSAEIVPETAEEMIEFSDAISDILLKRYEKLGVKIED